MNGLESNNVGSRRDYFVRTPKSKKSRNFSELTFKRKRNKTMSTSALSTPESEMGNVATFRQLPPFDAFTKFAWISVLSQVMVGIGGAVTSYMTGLGNVGGVMSGIFGLWFVQMAWVMSLPSKCSTLPYHIGLCMLPFWKSIGFLLVPGPKGEEADVDEFIERMLIIIFLWCLPMWLAGRTTAEVVRCMHGDISRLGAHNKPDSKTMFGSRSSKAIPVDNEGISIRERAMAVSTGGIRCESQINFFTLKQLTNDNFFVMISAQ